MESDSEINRKVEQVTLNQLNFTFSPATSHLSWIHFVRQEDNIVLGVGSVFNTKCFLCLDWYFWLSQVVVTVIGWLQPEPQWLFNMKGQYPPCLKAFPSWSSQNDKLTSAIIAQINILSHAMNRLNSRTVHTRLSCFQLTGAENHSMPLYPNGHHPCNEQSHIATPSMPLNWINRNFTIG